MQPVEAASAAAELLVNKHMEFVDSRVAEQDLLVPKLMEMVELVARSIGLEVGMERFGSRVTGTRNHDSDLDVVVYLEQWQDAYKSLHEAFDAMVDHTDEGGEGGPIVKVKPFRKKNRSSVDTFKLGLAV